MIKYKNFINTFLLFFLATLTYAQDPFTIHGVLNDPKFEGKEINVKNGTETLKSKINNGKFSISGTVSQSSYTLIWIDQDSIYKEAQKSGDTSILITPANKRFFLEKGVIQLEGNNFKDITIKGTNLNDQYLYFKNQVIKEVIAHKLKSPTAIENLEDSLSLVFMEQNPTTLVNIPLILRINKTYFVSKNVDRIEALYTNLSPFLRQRYGNMLLNKINEIKNIGIGSIAPNFTIKSDQGKDISLIDFRGKYVLVEFWAHYCIPCIKEIPYLKDAYKSFKDNNFDILQISLDKSKDHDKWINAVKRYSSDWHNAIDNNDLSKAAKTLYRVQGIPANFLIDPSGKIVAVDLKGDNLKSTLNNLLK